MQPTLQSTDTETSRRTPSRRSLVAATSLAWMITLGGGLGITTFGCSAICPGGTVEVEGRCVPKSLFRCIPACEGRACGDDGCGNLCGSCGGATPYCVAGSCAAECEPSCEGRVCGDDNCGGSCGVCEQGATCATAGRACIPSTYTCDANTYDDGALCHCACGDADPDCEDTTLWVAGCDKPGASCDAASTCQGGLDGEWTCDETRYADGNTCDCGCGLPDPDCMRSSLTVVGCSASQVCSRLGACVAGDCTPDCSGRMCGDDGCGGLCGVCTDEASFCNAGSCSAECVAHCGDNVCGGDGCGGSCGSCESGEHCVAGTCDALPMSDSCQGNCGGLAASGCSCEARCATGGEGCCLDAPLACDCFPRCGGKQCGDDGCGGSCGDCGANQVCSGARMCVTDMCTVDRCSGHGACDSETGACACSSGYDGAACGQCASTHAGYPNCVPSLCDVFSCNGHGACEGTTGACTCDSGFTGTDCEACTGTGIYPACP